MKVIATFLAVSLFYTQRVNANIGADCTSHADCAEGLFCFLKRLDGWAKGVIVMEKRGTCVDGR